MRRKKGFFAKKRINFFPFGMLLPNRHDNTPEYRYGFQGQEKDDEIKGHPGSSINYKYRMHDPRVGRFFATDPLERGYPYYSPYQFSGNRVIDMVELEGLETGNPALDYLYWATWGNFNKLGTIAQDGVKDMVQAEMKSDEYINNNPVYSQQDKDTQYAVKKLTGALKMTTAFMDPSVQLMNTISPVDDVLTLSTGQIYDVTEVRDASTLEKVFAGVEVIAFFIDVSVMSKPTQHIITGSAEEIIEEVSKDIVEESVSKFSHTIDHVDENIFHSTLKSLDADLPDITIRGIIEKTEHGIQLVVDIVPKTVDEGIETFDQAHKRLKGNYGIAIIRALRELGTEAGKVNNVEDVIIMNERATGINKGKIQSGSIKNKD